MRENRIVLQPRDFAFLRTLLESRILTAAHVSVLHFDGKHEMAKKRLQKLKAAGVIDERRRRVSDPALLFLTTKGLKLLKENGILAEYPESHIPTLVKRSRVSDLTIRHELEVLDVRAAFHKSLKGNPMSKIEEFCTWPACYEFKSMRSGVGREIPVKPDGFIRIHENEPNGGLFEHDFFLEVDRSTEVQDTLVNRAACYVEYYKSGGFAEWMGGTRDKPDEYPFRVLVVLNTAERRNNLAERLLQINPPIFARVWLTTFAEVKNDPLGKIWIRPRDYRDVIKGTQFDFGRERKAWAYRRQTEREMLVEAKIKKIGLFDALPQL
jgi:hypothetical protein